MTDENTTVVADKKVEETNSSAPKNETRPERGERKPRRPRRGGRQEREPKEFEESILQIDRVTRVTRGGRQLRFRISVVIGDKKGRVGFGIGKSGEVLVGIQKAVADAKRNLINVPTFNDTIPHDVTASFKASKVFLLPAPDGTGVIAGGALRKILELSGIKNVLSKMHGSRNKLNAAHATFEALKKLENKAPHTPKGEKESADAEAKADKKAKPVAKKAAPKKAPTKKAPAKKPVAKKTAPKADKK